MSTVENATIVVALDIGTSYSGYAHLTKAEFNENPMRVSTNKPWDGPRRSTMKCPTVPLVEPDKKTYSFGYDAQSNYKELVMIDKDNSTEKRRKWAYFSRFKMHLHRDQNLSRDSKLEADNGDQLPAIAVFAMAIEFLQRHFLDSLKRQGLEIKHEKIMWVLTVPALWSDAAKQIMREAAHKAGILDKKLILALEPEAAAIYCHLDCSKQQEEYFQKVESFNKPGAQFILCDLGGGTADISVLEVLSGGKLKQIHESGGGPWGGTTVEDNFLKVVRDLVGKNTMCAFEKDYPEEYLRIIEEFETAKRALSRGLDSRPNGRMRIQLPGKLKHVYEKQNKGEKFENLPEQNKYKGHLSLKSEEIVLHKWVVAELFTPSSEGVISYLKRLFDNPPLHDIGTILLVGGFSSASLVEDDIRKAFPSKTVMVPREAELSVLKGAVLFGHNPAMISQRIVRHTYGVNYSPNFKEDQHDPDKRYTDRDGNVLCKDCFSKFVERGQAIQSSEPITRMYFPNSKQTAMLFNVYRSHVVSPTYVTEKSCTMVGAVNIPMPDVTQGENRTVVVRMYIGETELRIEAELEDSGEQIEAKFDCLALV